MPAPVSLHPEQQHNHADMETTATSFLSFSPSATLDTVDIAFIERSLEDTRSNMAQYSPSSFSSSSGPDTSVSSLVGLGITSGGSPISMGIVDLNTRGTPANNIQAQNIHYSSSDSSFFGTASAAAHLKFSDASPKCFEDFVLVQESESNTFFVDDEMDMPGDGDEAFTDSYADGIRSTSTPIHGQGRGVILNRGHQRLSRGLQANGLFASR